MASKVRYVKLFFNKFVKDDVEQGNLKKRLRRKGRVLL